MAAAHGGQVLVAAVTALGYEEQFVKAKTIDEERELKAAAKWREEREEERKPRRTRRRRRANGKLNGHFR